MRSVVAGFLLSFGFAGFSFADEPFGHIHLEVQIEGDETRQPVELRVPIYRYDREPGGLIVSLESPDVTMYVPGTANQLTITPLPKMAGFKFQERVNARGMAFESSSGAGRRVQGFIENNILTTLHGKHRFPFAHELHDVAASLSLNRETLLVASNKTKRVEIIPKGTRGTSLPFPHGNWNAVEAGPVGGQFWVVVFTDGPSHEPPFVPSLNNFKPPPKPVRTNAAYIVDARGFRTQPFFQWKSTRNFSVLAAVKTGSLFVAYGEKDLGDYKGFPQLEHTETSIWIDEKGQASTPTARQLREIHDLPIAVTESAILRWNPAQNGERASVTWIENGKTVKTDALPYQPSDSRYQDLRSVFPEGAYLIPTPTHSRITGPDVLSNSSPKRDKPPKHLLPVTFNLYRRNGAPIGLKFSHGEGEDALTNPRNYSVLSARGHIWLLSAGERDSKKMYAGCLPLEMILTAVRYE